LLQLQATPHIVTHFFVSWSGYLTVTHVHPAWTVRRI